MTARHRWPVAVVLAVGLCSVGDRSARGDGPPNREPSPLPLAGSANVPYNQRIAEAVVDHLQNSGRLRHYRIDVSYRNGTAVLSGQIADAAQKTEAMRLAREVPGVSEVVDRLAVHPGGAIRPAQAVSPPPLPEPGPLPKPVPELNGRVPPEPAPIFLTPPAPNPALQPPRMPPYAWPTYAPYNNYSRVAHPTLYPYQAWPFIGPFHPFPKVPLGWRSIKLEWMDGHWWYGRYANGHDWWRIRYW